MSKEIYVHKVLFISYNLALHDNSSVLQSCFIKLEPNHNVHKITLLFSVWTSYSQICFSAKTVRKQQKIHAWASAVLYVSFD